MGTVTADATEFADLYDDSRSLNIDDHKKYSMKGMAMLRLEVCIEEIVLCIERMTMAREQLHRRVMMRRFVIDTLYNDTRDAGHILARKKIDNIEVAVVQQQQRQVDLYINALRAEYKETKEIYDSMMKCHDGPLASLIVEVDRVASVTHADKEDTCCLCLDTIRQGDVVMKLDECGHVFHYTPSDACILIADSKCPMCRSTFVNKF